MTKTAAIHKCFAILSSSRPRPQPPRSPARPLLHPMKEAVSLASFILATFSVGQFWRKPQQARQRAGIANRTSPRGPNSSASGPIANQESPDHFPNTPSLSLSLLCTGWPTKTRFGNAADVFFIMWMGSESFCWVTLHTFPFPHSRPGEASAMACT